MRIPLPGPSAVLGSAVAAADAVETAIGLVPRMADALTRVEGILDRVEVVVAQAETVVDSADRATGRTHATLDRADAVTTQAGRQSDAAAGVLDRLDHSLTTWEPILRRLSPAAERFAAGLDAREVDAAIALVDRLPTVLEHLDEDVLPVLTTLDRVGPDLHELLRSPRTSVASSAACRASASCGAVATTTRRPADHPAPESRRAASRSTAAAARCSCSDIEVTSTSSRRCGSSAWMGRTAPSSFSSRSTTR